MIKLALIDNGIPYHMRNNRNQRIVHKSFWLLNAIQVSIKTINHSMALYASELSQAYVVI